MSEVTPPASFRLSEGPVTGGVGQLVGALDVLATAAGVRRLRDWAREALAVGPGERAVDLGSGTGEEVQRLAALGGEAIGVEPIPGLLAEATRRAAVAGSAARFVAGSAYELPFEESTVDVLRCERVFQHLEEPERAALEIARVLRPGGRVALLDSDWETAILYPGDRAVIQSLQRFWLERSANPFAGRRLAGLLTAAGLSVVDQASQALIQTFDALRGLFDTMGSRAIAAGVISPAQWAVLLSSFETAAVRGDFHCSVTMFGVLGRKP